MGTRGRVRLPVLTTFSATNSDRVSGNDVSLITQVTHAHREKQGNEGNKRQTEKNSYIHQKSGKVHTVMDTNAYF